MSQQMSTTVNSSSPNQSENEGSMLAETTQQLNCSVAEDEYVSCQICFMNFIKISKSILYKANCTKHKSDPDANLDPPHCNLHSLVLIV